MAILSETEPHHSPTPDSSARHEAGDDEYERVWQAIPLINAELEPTDERPHRGFVIESPPGFVEAEISDDAERVYQVLTADCPSIALLEHWAVEEGIDLRQALAELNGWGVLEKHTVGDGGVSVKRRYFFKD